MDGIHSFAQPRKQNAVVDMTIQQVSMQNKVLVVKLYEPEQKTKGTWLQ